MIRIQPQQCHPRSTPGVPAALMAVAVILFSSLGQPVEVEAHPADMRPSPQAPAPDTTEAIPLEPLEVSVLRVPFATDSAPLAVGALSESDLRLGRSGAFLDEALQGLPGVQVQNRHNPAVGERIVIRGFGGGASANFGVRGIRVLVDGIPATLPDGQSTIDHLDIGSLGRVEAIRGPSSALFGNASGGVLAFTSRAPSALPFELDLETVGGSHGLRRLQASASGTVEGTGYLVTASTQSRDGYRSVLSDSPRADTVGTTYGASDRLGLNARLTRAAAGGELSFTANILDLEAENAGSITNDFRADPDLDVLDLYLRFRTGKEVTQQQAGLRWVGPLGTGEWNADFSLYGIHRTVLNPIPFNVIDLSRRGGGVRAQLGHRLATDLGDLEWHVGVDLDLQDDDRMERDAIPLTGQPADGAPPSIDQAENVRSTGIFLQGTMDLPAGAVALAGLRYDSQRFEVDDRLTPAEGQPAGSGTRTMDAFSPSLGVSVPIGTALNAFASVGTVFETPTTTAFKNQPGSEGGFNQELNPTTGRSFEVGVRGRAGSNAAFELTTYRTNLSNELVSFEIPGAEGATFLRNAGESRHQGVEATLLMASRGGGVRSTLTYAYTDARFTEFVLGDENLADNRLPAVAPHRAQVNLRYQPAAWFAEVAGSYVDRVPANDQNTASAPAYSVVDLRAGVRAIAVGNVDISPWIAVTNVLDETFITSVVVNATGNRYFEPGPPRSFQLGLRTTWGSGAN